MNTSFSILPVCSQVHRRQANEASVVEQQRRLDEIDHLSTVEIEQRVSVASKLLDVHKEMLSTHEPTKVSFMGEAEVWRVLLQLVVKIVFVCLCLCVRIVYRLCTCVYMLVCMRAGLHLLISSNIAYTISSYCTSTILVIINII